MRLHYICKYDGFHKSHITANVYDYWYLFLPSLITHDSLINIFSHRIYFETHLPSDFAVCWWEAPNLAINWPHSLWMSASKGLLSGRPAANCRRSLLPGSAGRMSSWWGYIQPLHAPLCSMKNLSQNGGDVRSQTPFWRIDTGSWESACVRGYFFPESAPFQTSRDTPEPAARLFGPPLTNPIPGSSPQPPLAS